MPGNKENFHPHSAAIFFPKCFYSFDDAVNTKFWIRPVDFSKTSGVTASIDGETISASIRSRRTRGSSSNVPSWEQQQYARHVFDTTNDIADLGVQRRFAGARDSNVVKVRIFRNDFLHFREDVFRKKIFLSRKSALIGHSDFAVHTIERAQFFRYNVDSERYPNRRDGTGPNVYFRCVDIALSKTRTSALQFRDA